MPFGLSVIDNGTKNRIFDILNSLNNRLLPRERHNTVPALCREEDQIYTSSNILVLNQLPCEFSSIHLVQPY